MKKTVALLLAVLLLLCCGCSQTNKSANNTSSKKTGSNEVSSAEKTDDSGENQDTSSTDTSDNVIDVTVGQITTSDGFVDMEFIETDEPEEETTTVVVDKPVDTLKTKWQADASVPSGKTDAQANVLRNKILNAPNTLENYKITGTKYYVSPKGNNNNDGKSPKTAVKDMNASIFRMNLLKPGDAVLFERGGVWRFTSAYKCKKGVTYGSYGTGLKPRFYGSAKNYADKDIWIPSNLKNVWKLTVADIDIGIIIFDHGEMVGVKKLNGLVALEKNGDFYYNKNQDTIYLYYDKGNPGSKFKDIEVGLKMPLFHVSTTEVTLDNLCLKYTGTFGVDLDSGADNSVITNCEIGFVGGAIQSGTTRYGNGIQCWNGVNHHVVKNNWVYQCYDTGITWQGDYDNGVHDVYKNITYESNLVEYCCLSFEFWHANNGATYISPATVDNFKMINNISRFAGYGWGKQRPDPTGSHICGWQHMYPTAKGNEISGNSFDTCTNYMVNWRIQVGGNNGEWNISNNYWYHGKTVSNQGLIYGSWMNASDLTSLKAAVAIFDKNPAKVEWIS